MKNFWKIFSLILIIFFMPPSYAAPPNEVGIILLHGKGSSPRFHILDTFKAKLMEMGYQVSVPQFPWAGKKGKANYSGDLEDAFKIITSEVTTLKNSGRKKIILAGHSMGTPAAIAFVVANSGVDGVIGIAPGHFVDTDFHKDFTSSDISKARKMTASGEGDNLIDVKDYNSGGRRFELKVKVKDYLSFFDPTGAMNLSKALQNIGNKPLLWIAPNNDPVTKKGWAKTYYSKIPDNVRSKYIVIDAEHINAPVKGIKQIHKWIEGL
jgi:pimeloyl-ACP methyl ester carboxylesterase